MNAHDLAYQLYMMAKNNEGGTVPANDEPLPTTGYWIGGKYPPLVFKSVAELDRGEIAWWIGTHRARWYGSWVDQETGKVHLDAVTHMHYRGTALDLGQVRGEISIWDISQGQEIRVGSDD